MAGKKIFFATLIVVAIFILNPIFICINVTGSQSWSQYKNGPCRNGNCEFSTLNNPGGLKWTYEENVSWDQWNGFPTSCVIDSNGTIYFGSGENSNSGHGMITSLNPDGSVRWLSNLTGRALSSPAIGKDGSVLVTDGNLTAFGPEGQVRWCYKDGFGPISGSPLVTTNGTILAIVESASLVCISWNGTLIWKYNDTGIFGTPSCSPKGDVILLSRSSKDQNKTVMRSLSSNGTFLWKYGPFASSVSYPCVASNGTIYIGGEDSSVLAISNNGSLLWRFATVGPVRGAPSLDLNEMIVVCTGYANSGSDLSHWEDFWSQRLYVLTSNGEVIWSAEGGNYLSSPSISSSGEIFAVSGPSITSFNPNGTKKWSYTYWPLFDRWSPNSIAIGGDGTVFVNTQISILALGNGTPGCVQGLKGNLWGSKLELEWKAPESIGADSILEYRIYVSHIIWGDPSSQTDYELLAIVPGDQMFFQYEGAQLYDTYQIYAVNEYGVSELSSHYYVDQDQQSNFSLVLFVALTILFVVVVIYILKKRG